MIKNIRIDLPYEKILAQRIEKNQPNIGVVVIIKHQNKYLLVKNRKYPSQHWLFLTGRVEKNEIDDKAAIREVKEETNLKVIGIKKIAVIKPKNINNAKLSVYKCTTCGNIAISDELTEIGLFKKIPDTIHPMCKLIIEKIKS